MDTADTLRNRSSLLLATLLLIGSAAVLAGENPGGEARLSLTTQFTKAARDRGEAGTVSQDEFAALATGGDRTAGKGSRGQAKLSAQSSQSPDTDFWFYSADVILFNDNDGDGFFHGIDLLFDADTYYSSAEVYAVAYLSYEGGPWNEYAVTDDFIINGATSDDEYVIVTELVSGYPSGSYDLLIELFDAYDDAYLAGFGPSDTSALAFLQLEDANRDAVQGTTTVIVRDGGGGALGWLMLLALVAAAFPGRSVRRGF